jgi:hypothetical protein
MEMDEEVSELVAVAVMVLDWQELVVAAALAMHWEVVRMAAWAMVAAMALVVEV